MNILTQEAKKRQSVVRYANKIGSHLFTTQRINQI